MSVSVLLTEFGSFGSDADFYCVGSTSFLFSKFLVFIRNLRKMWHLWEELCPIIAHHSVQGWPPPSFLFPWILLVDVFVFYCRYWLWDLSLTVLCFWLFCLTKSRKNKRNWWSLWKISMKRKKEECAATCPCSRCLTEMTSDHILWAFFWLLNELHIEKVKNLPTVQNVSEMLQSFQLLHFRKTCRGKQERWKCDS